jgi:hypothetical protein
VGRIEDGGGQTATGDPSDTTTLRSISCFPWTAFWTVIDMTVCVRHERGGSVTRVESPKAVLRRRWVVWPSGAAPRHGGGTEVCGTRQNALLERATAVMSSR